MKSKQTWPWAAHCVTSQPQPHDLRNMYMWHFNTESQVTDKKSGLCFWKIGNLDLTVIHRPH